MFHMYVYIYIYIYSTFSLIASDLVQDPESMYPSQNDRRSNDGQEVLINTDGLVQDCSNSSALANGATAV